MMVQHHSLNYQIAALPLCIIRGAQFVPEWCILVEEAGGWRGAGSEGIQAITSRNDRSRSPRIDALWPRRGLAGRIQRREGDSVEGSSWQVL